MRNLYFVLQKKPTLAQLQLKASKRQNRNQVELRRGMWLWKKFISRSSSSTKKKVCFDASGRKTLEMSGSKSSPKLSNQEDFNYATEFEKEKSVDLQVNFSFYIKRYILQLFFIINLLFSVYIIHG